MKLIIRNYFAAYLSQEEDWWNRCDYKGWVHIFNRFQLLIYQLIHLYNFLACWQTTEIRESNLLREDHREQGTEKKKVGYEWQLKITYSCQNLRISEHQLF